MNNWREQNFRQILNESIVLMALINLKKLDELHL